MKNIIRFLLATILISFVISTGLFVLNRQDVKTTNNSPSIKSDLYHIEIGESTNTTIDPPTIPDLSHYNVASLRQKIPEFAEGLIEVKLLKEGYPKLRNQLAYFGDRQDRFDPLSITISTGVVSLEDIVVAVNDDSLIEKKTDNSYVLYVPLVINQKATLRFQAGETLMMSVNTGAVLPIFGAVHVMDATIIGWDTTQDQPAYFKSAEKFRPYIVAWCDGELNIANSYIGHLGYDYSKAYGLSYSSCESPLYVEDGVSLSSGTGWIIDSEIEQLYFGFYSYETDGAVLINNKYKDNIVYGIDPHDYSKNLIIAKNHIFGTQQKHGFIVSRGVTDSLILNNISENNAGTGMMFDRQSSNNIIAGNISQHNNGDGLTFYESPNNFIMNNILINNNGSGLRIRNSEPIISYQDTMNENENFAVQLYGQTLKNRDNQKDPYEETASVTIYSPEISGNAKGLFKLENIESFTISKPHIFDAVGALFSGDIESDNHGVLHKDSTVSVKAK